MYAVTSMPFDRRTRAILRSAEFGFLGVMVRTWVHTPRRCGAPFADWVVCPFCELYNWLSAGALGF